MEENGADIHIDIMQLAKQLADRTLGELVASLMPDEKTKKFWAATLAVHRKYGIDAATSMKIMTELADLIKDENEAKTVNDEWIGDMYNA